MQHYTRGEPLSQIRNLHGKGDPAPDLNLWSWGPMKNHLLAAPVGKGYKGVPRTVGTIVQASLMSQLYDFDLIMARDDPAKAMMWAKEEDIEQAAACPVILCHALDHKPEEDHAYLLGPLPVPWHGSYAFVGEGENLLLYFIENLPEKTKAKYQQVRQKIIDLADAAKPDDIDHMWVNATPLHRSVADERTFQLFQQQTVSNILKTTNPQERETYEQQLNMILLYRNHILMIDRLLQLSDYQERFQEIAHMMQQLAGDYYKHHLRQQERPEAVNAFQSGSALAPTSQTMQLFTFATQNAVSKGADQWKNKKGQAPFYTRGNDILEYKESESSFITDDVSNALWEQVKKHQTDLQIDLGFFAIALCIRSKEPDHSAWVYASAFLESRGLTKSTKQVSENVRRNAGWRPDNYREVAQGFSNLEKIWLTINQPIDLEEYDRKTKKRKKSRFTYKGRFLVVKGALTQKDLGTTDREGVEIAWHIAPGDWLATFLEAPNRQVAYLSERALQYDPYRQKWEKYLARYFFFNGHMNAKGHGSVFNRQIDRLLQDCSLEVEQDRQQRTRDHFEKAMDQIRKDGFIDSWRYTNHKGGYIPSKRSWLNEWLEQMITVEIAPRKQVIP